MLHNGIRNRGRVWSPSIVQYICSRTVSAAVKRGKSPFKENLFNKTIVLSHCHPTLLRFALAFIAAVWNITNFYGKNSILCIYSSYNNFSPSSLVTILICIQIKLLNCKNYTPTSNNSFIQTQSIRKVDSFLPR